MRKLGEQWIEEIDGYRHLVKAVPAIEKCHCTACDFEGQGNLCFGFPNSLCGNASDEFILKDLGILNNDGCLPSPWGGYPKIIHEVDQDRTESGEDVHYDNLWCVEIHKPVLICTDEYPTKQQAIDAWNRRV